MKLSISKIIMILAACLFSACSHRGKNAQFAPASESERAYVQAFRRQVGQDRTETWKMLDPLLTNRLAIVPKNKFALADFFVKWLGPSEDEALKRSEDTALWPSSPGTNRGDVLAYQLK